MTVNIQEAKDSVRNAVSAYLDKDAAGNYVIPRARQRPLVVMGAPGLGKTAIMSQVAAELGIGFVSYAMTHHTRQSAIGLPMIEQRSFGGETMPITRYTMSEIIASVYEAIDVQGKREGILFIDEVNCVSETLSSAMLDLLQNKKFGPHRIPDGWVLVAAGNPPEFNSSAREFDIATLDRIRMIEVEPDTDVWLRYAMSAGVHDAITYYLQIKPQNLLTIESTPEGPSFATPRAWEDLSTVIREHEKLGLTVDVNLISQYIRNPDIAAEFKRYLDFHRKYSRDHDVESILNGTATDVTGLAGAGAEAKLSVISVLIGSLNSDAEQGMDLRAFSRACARLDPEDPEGSLKALRSELEATVHGNATREASREAAYCLSALHDLRPDAESVREMRTRSEDEERSWHTRFDGRLENAMDAMRRAFGTGQEPVSLLSGLLGCYSVVMYSEPDGPLYRYNDEMLSGGHDKRIAEALEGLE